MHHGCPPGTTRKTGSLDARARAWLEINCAHCHNPAGPARNSGLDLLASQTNPTAYGVYKAPVAAGRGSGGREFDIVPGQPDKSIMVYRIASTDGGIMMPELGKRLVHEEGLALIREWIAAMADEGKPRARGPGRSAQFRASAALGPPPRHPLKARAPRARSTEIASPPSPEDSGKDKRVRRRGGGRSSSRGVERSGPSFRSSAIMSSPCATPPRTMSGRPARTASRGKT